MRTFPKLLIVAVALVVGAGLGAVGTVVAAGGGPSSAASEPAATAVNTAMMGGGQAGGTAMMHPGSTMMGDAMMGAAGGRRALVPAARLEALSAQAARQAQIRGATVTYGSTRVTMVALGAPGNRPGMFWQIDGVVNPTVVVPAGAVITVDFADADPGHPHGFEVATAAPPYPRMAMMAGAVAAPGAFIMPVPAPQGGSWYEATTTFTAPTPGTYYYRCPVPGHAQAGMWGKLVVR